MASDTLKVFGTTYTNVAGIKATDSSDATKTYIRPEGSQTITSNGTYDVTSKASAIVNVSSGGTDVSDTTATAADVLNPAYFYTSAGVKTQGTMTSMTLPTMTEFTSSGSLVTYIGRSNANKYLNIPSGYNSSNRYYQINATPNGVVTAPSSITGTGATVSTGTNTLTLSEDVSVTPSVTTEGYVTGGTAGTASVSLTASVNTRAASTITPSTTNQTIASNTYLTGDQTISGDANLIASNIKSGTSIFGVSGSYSGTDVSDTTATAADVLETKDFYLANGTKTTGTMVDYSGDSVAIPSASSSGIGMSGGFIHYKVPEAGYYDTDSKILGVPTKFGNAAASDVASGKTFTSSAGFKVTGTASICTLLATQSLGSQSTTSTSAVEIDQTVTVSGINDYDLLIVETSVDTVTLNRHTSTTGLILLAATSTIGTKTGGTISTLKHNTKISSSSVTSARTNTTAYGVYPSAISLSSGTATITMSKKYNSTQTGTINGTYTTRVYGVSLFDLIGG